MISLIQHFEADFLSKVSLKILNSRNNPENFHPCDYSWRQIEYPALDKAAYLQSDQSYISTWRNVGHLATQGAPI